MSALAGLALVLLACGVPVSDRIEGVIRLDPAPAALRGVTVHVRLQDVGLADAPARTVDEDVRRDVTYDPATDPPLTFRLSTAAIPHGSATHVVTAHVDLDGDGQVARGDYVTTQSSPVDRGTRSVEIVLHRV